MDNNRFSSANALRNLMEIKANKDRSVPNTNDTVVEPEKELDPVFSRLLDKKIDLEEVIANDRKRLGISDDLVLSEDHRIYLAKKLLELEELRETVNHGLALHKSNYLYKSDLQRGVVRESSTSSSSADSGSVSGSDNYSCKDITKTEFDSGSTSGSSYSCSANNCFSWDKYAGPIQNQGKPPLCYLYAAYGVTEYLVGKESGASGTVFSAGTANTCLGVAKQCPSGATLDKGLQLLCTGAYNEGQTGDCSNLLDPEVSIFQTGSRILTSEKNYKYVIRSEPTMEDINTMINNLSKSPIIIGIDGSSNSIQHYYPNSSGEPLTPLCTTYYDHAVVIVGYDETTNVFKIRNSWGPSWGDDGYFYLDAIPGNYGLGTVYIYNISLGSNQGKCPEGYGSDFQTNGCCISTCPSPSSSSTGAVLTSASDTDTNCCNDDCTVTEWQRYSPPQLFQADTIPCYPNLQLDDGTEFTYPNMDNYTYDGSVGWTSSVIKENDEQIFTKNIMNVLPVSPIISYFFSDLWDLTKDPPTSTICTNPTKLVNTSGTLSNIDIGNRISSTTYPQYWYTDDNQKSKSFYMLLNDGYVALFFSDGTMKVVGDWDIPPEGSEEMPHYLPTTQTINLNSSYSMEISTNILSTSQTTEYTATYKITSPISS